jgi:hypothetical protein
VDFLLLVNSTYPNDTVRIDDSCMHCTQRISMMIERGKVKEISPGTAIVFRGGG